MKKKIIIGAMLFLAVGCVVLIAYLLSLPDPNAQTASPAPPTPEQPALAAMPQQIAALVAQLADKNEQNANAAADELKKIGQPAVAPLAAAWAAAAADPALRARIDSVLAAINQAPAVANVAAPVNAPAPNEQPKTDKPKLPEGMPALGDPAAQANPPAPVKPLPPPPKPTPEQEKKIAELIRQLGDDDWKKSYAATRELYRMGRMALAQLASVRSENDEVTQRAALLVSVLRAEEVSAQKGIVATDWFINNWMPQLMAGVMDSGGGVGNPRGTIVLDGRGGYTIMSKDFIFIVEKEKTTIMDEFGIITSSAKRQLETVNYEKAPARARLSSIRQLLTYVFMSGVTPLNSNGQGGIVTLDEWTVKAVDLSIGQVAQSKPNAEPPPQPLLLMDNIGPRPKLGVAEADQPKPPAPQILQAGGPEGAKPLVIIDGKVQGAEDLPKPPRPDEVASGDLTESFGAKLGEAADGLRVVDVRSGSPADKAGLKAGDLITKVGGREAAKLDDVKELLTSPAPRLQIEITRKNESVTLILPAP